MTATYDQYYQTENLFGKPFPELIEFFAGYSGKGKVLDLGCGQGRDSVPLARLGFNVTGIDSSQVGIEQMNRTAEAENLTLTAKVTDIFEFDNFAEYDFILLNSMFHFAKNDREQETNFIKRILSKIKNGCRIVFCVQDTGKKIDILNKTIDFEKPLNRLADKKLEYVFENKENGHKSKTNYRMVIVEK